MGTIGARRRGRARLKRLPARPRNAAQVLSLLLVDRKHFELPNICNNSAHSTILHLAGLLRLRAIPNERLWWIAKAVLQQKNKNKDDHRPKLHSPFPCRHLLLRPATRAGHLVRLFAARTRVRVLQDLKLALTQILIGQQPVLCLSFPVSRCKPPSPTEYAGACCSELSQQLFELHSKSDLTFSDQARERTKERPARRKHRS